ncbi:CRISPR-associated helicase Cas3' [Wenzhouxiangella sp. AB-CW3]|uniref:type I-G CRISPR-associated helicase/endonuclease Cas3g n=1 Tax=Wenzhouxiangella sp. AB-CW3 TaxID=2771012 RepID=UPI00168ADD85|nr:CRISPR-associated helicase Cas3' [Wenzhouxiangella sp. AB-CW3]QOC21484.1 CRISPR-associated helicase Cas3' [Wenzhouxiangella sp. AB-CW3]
MGYSNFFRKATGHAAYPFQEQLALGAWPDILNVPTGLGKTAAVTLAWLYRRRELQDSEIPRRLVWCLPMRVLVEQTRTNVESWLKELGCYGEPGDGQVSVSLLMGGEPSLREAQWASFPDEDAILIGTQDMLLSRALMRGYGMSRYQWPVHFGLLHNDALWVYDEVQLMGPALPTTAQLDAFRHRHGTSKPARSLWVSATLDSRWLATVDFRDRMDQLTISGLTDNDRKENEVTRRLNAEKSLLPSRTCLTKETAKKKAASYIQSLAAEVAESHHDGQQTLVIVNRVERAQALYKALRKQLPDTDTLLLHARFRPPERKAIEKALQQDPAKDGSGRVVIATQAVEAGVDISSAVLFTELAPWSSLVQRFGRCNRHGEHQEARVYWIDIEDDAGEAAPYTSEALQNARQRVKELDSACPSNLPRFEESAPLYPVLRHKDLMQLFDTDPDLSGFDVDVSPYIRDPGSPQLQVFWRDFTGQPDTEISPARDELCPAGLGQFKEFLSRKGRDAWAWDPLGERWQPTRQPRPGQILLLRSADGGYDRELGFDRDAKRSVDVITQAVERTEEPPESNDAELLTFIGQAIELAEHSQDAEAELRFLADRLDLPAWQQKAAATADLWHDLGKAHEAFQRGIQPDYEPGTSPMLAKSGGRGRPDYHVLDEDGNRIVRRGFRHELASMLAWLKHGDHADHKDLIAYLICAHHGRIRMRLRALPNEPSPPEPERLFSRGLWDRDRLPEIRLNGMTVPETELRLDLMQLGRGPDGPSWTERTHRLLDLHGPFELAWLEALVRIADWKASRAESGSGGRT